MKTFVKNVNAYIEHYKIKKSFIAKKTGIEKNKLSRLLNNKQDILHDDMILIAETLGKDVNYFMQDKLSMKTPEYKNSSSIAFYMGTPDEEKVKLANQAFDFLEHIDAIMGVRKRLDQDILEVAENGV